MNNDKIIIAGIGTGVGKTVISAIVVEALEADYWKPVQAGNLDQTDTDTVRSLISNPNSFFHKEAIRLTHPMSPHAAAKLEGMEINLGQIILPKTKNKLVIELAGGLMVPLNKKYLNIDLLVEWKAPLILVSQNYLGSINHTLLSVALLKQVQVPLAGIIFNGEKNEASEKFILEYSQTICIGRMEPEVEIKKEVVKRYAKKFQENLYKI